MAWEKETNIPMNGWIGLQEKMLKNWWDVLAQPQNGQSATSPNFIWNPWTVSDVETWQSYFQQALAAPSQTMMADISNQVMSQFFSGQAQAQQLLSMVTEAWQAMLTNATSPAEWQTALTAYTDQLRQQLHSAMDSAKLLENNAELWRLYAQEAQKWMQPWSNVWWQTPSLMSNVAGAQQAEIPKQFLQLYQAAFEQTIGRALLAPGMGLLREFNEKVNQGFVLWVENQQAQFAYQLSVSEAWVNAFQALMRKLIDMAQKGELLEDDRHLLRIWVEVADEVFLELFHSEAYAKIQSAYVNSNMALRRQQGELLDIWLRANQLPTRHDLDEAHRAIYELRKEVKTLKKAAAQPAETTKTPAKTGTSSKSKSRKTTTSKRKKQEGAA